MYFKMHPPSGIWFAAHNACVSLKSMKVWIYFADVATPPHPQYLSMTHSPPPEESLEINPVGGCCPDLSPTALDADNQCFGNLAQVIEAAHTTAIHVQFVAMLRSNNSCTCGLRGATQACNWYYTT